MKIMIFNDLPIVSVEIHKDGKSIQSDKILVDTGSVDTVLNGDIMGRLDIQYTGDEPLNKYTGVGGGEEFCIICKVDVIKLGNLKKANFPVAISDMDYAKKYDVDGIIGVDFLIATNAVINLKKMQLQEKGWLDKSIEIKIIGGLPLINGVEIENNGSSIKIDNLLLDTGTLGTIFTREAIEELEINTTEQNIKAYKGTGGEVEYCSVTKIDKIKFENLSTKDFDISILDSDSSDLGGFNGIIGFDFLIATNAVFRFKN